MLSKIIARMKKVKNKLSDNPKILIAVLVVFLIVMLVIVRSGLAIFLTDDRDYQVPTYKVQRELMRVTVSAGGTLQAMKNYEVKSEVEGSNQILEVIPEGTIITREDVEDGRVLMRLDASKARDDLEKQKISVEDASAAYTQAKEDYTIQEGQNESDIAQAELDVKFTRMELERYLGNDLAQKAIDGDIDFEVTDWHDDIKGASLQERRDLENNVSLAGEELSRSEDSLHWTRELVEKGYVNRDELDADELETKRRTVELEGAETELELFLKYVLAKEAEEELADYTEAKRSLERTEARARSRIAQSEANLKSRRATYELQKEKQERLKEMIEKSTVQATRPGLIVYASTTNPRQYRNNPVEEGMSVREGQTVLTVPDLSTLAARVEVPETQAQMISSGQPAEIVIDAMPDETWQGEVQRVSPMATQQSGFRALTGGSSGYETDVVIKGVDSDNTSLKPGMSATTEIEVATVPSALSVPIHAVTTRDGHRVCWVDSGKNPELREVELGFYTDTHVQIRRGLKEGEKVLLSQPERVPRDIEIVKLPEKAIGDKLETDLDIGESLDTDSDASEADTRDNDDEEEKEKVEEILEKLDPDVRDRIRERLNDPQSHDRIIEMLQDEESRERLIKRMRNMDDDNGERRGQGRPDGNGRRR
ncbi:MAG: efflux RND transporter periplasmic adaptor subunit [Verrucomicrobiota bacterium]